MRHVSREGGIAYTLSLKEQIDELFSLGLLHGTFYRGADEIEENAHEVLQSALTSCPEYATEKAIEGAVKNGLKTVPILWLLHLSTLEDKKLFKEAFPQIVKNPLMLHTLLDYAKKGTVREGAGRVIKNTANQWLMENLTEYWSCRYRTKLKDIVRITRPKTDIGSEEFRTYMDYIQYGKLAFDRIRKLKEVLSHLEADEVEETTLSMIEAERFQLDELKHQFGKMSEENLGKVYRAVFKELSYPALIMNLASSEMFLREEEPLLDRIADAGLYRKSGMLPFSLIAAHYLVQSPKIRAAIRKVLLEISSDRGGDGPLTIVVDTSSSMSYGRLTKSLSAMDVSALFASLLRHQLPQSRLYAVASDRMEIEKGHDIFETAESVTGAMLGMGTKLGQIMEEKPEGDLLVFTDSETGDDLESAWIEGGGERLIIWQMVNSNLRVSRHPSVIYLQGYNQESWNTLYGIIGGKRNEGN